MVATGIEVELELVSYQNLHDMPYIYYAVFLFANHIMIHFVQALINQTPWFDKKETLPKEIYIYNILASSLQTNANHFERYDHKHINTKYLYFYGYNITYE